MLKALTGLRGNVSEVESFSFIVESFSKCGQIAFQKIIVGHSACVVLSDVY